MPGLQFDTSQLLKVSRDRAQTLLDGLFGPARASRYGEQTVVPMVRKQHALADEGSYFTANNGQTAITGQALAAVDLTKPSLVIDNTDSPTNPAAKRIYIDYLTMLAGATAYSNSTSNTITFAHIALDTINRYSSGGTELAINNPNGDYPQKASVARVYAGALTLATAKALRHLSGYRLMRLPVSATAMSLANVDRWFCNFGGVENAGDQHVQASATLEATAVARNIGFPPVVIGPGQSFLFYITNISNSGATGGTLHYDCGWWER